MNSKNQKLGGILLAVLFLSACATGPRDPMLLGESRQRLEEAAKKLEPDEVPVRRQDSNTLPQNGSIPIAITRLGSADDSWGEPTEIGSSFNGMYTKLVVHSRNLRKAPGTAGTGATGTGNEVEFLEYKTRNALARALWGYDYSVTLTAKLHVKDTLDLTAPLVIVGHQSNSDGETWLREINFQRSDFPLFLFRSDGTSVPSLTLEVKGSSSVASRGAAAAVSAITGIAKVSGADPAVITKLTEASTRTATQQVDNAISKLFSSSVTERFVSDRDLKRWTETGTAGPSGLMVTLNLPRDEREWNSNLGQVGQWILTFANPRPSIFYEWSVCANDDPKKRCSKEADGARKMVAEHATGADILHFKLVPAANTLGQVDAYLRQQKWFTDASVALARTGDLTSAKNNFCQNVVDAMTALGLNEFDGQLVLWAVNLDMPTGFPALDSPKCSSHLNRITTFRTRAEVR